MKRHIPGGTAFVLVASLAGCGAPGSSSSAPPDADTRLEIPDGPTICEHHPLTLQTSHLVKSGVTSYGLYLHDGKVGKIVSDGHRLHEIDENGAETEILAGGWDEGVSGRVTPDGAAIWIVRAFPGQPATSFFATRASGFSPVPTDGTIPAAVAFYNGTLRTLINTDASTWTEMSSLDGITWTALGTYGGEAGRRTMQLSGDGCAVGLAGKPNSSSTYMALGERAADGEPFSMPLFGHSMYDSDVRNVQVSPDWNSVYYLMGTDLYELTP